MKIVQSKFKLYFFSAAILTLAITAMRTVSILTVYESNIGYYKRGALLPTVQQWVIIFSVALFVVLGFLIRKKDIHEGHPAPSHISTFSSFLCGSVQISSAALLLLYQRGPMAPVTVVILVGFAFATVYFFYDALCPPEKKTPLEVLPAMAAVIGLIAVIVKIHLDYTVTMNSPNKTMIFLAFATVSLFIMQELRFIVGRPQPRVYLTTASIAFLTCSAVSIPGIIGHYTNTLSGGDFLIYYIIAFAYAVYSFVRLFLYTRFLSFPNALSDELAGAERAPDEALEAGDLQ